MQIESLDDLQTLEDEIRVRLQQHNLESVLLGLRHYAEPVEAFVIAGTALFAVRHCTAGHHTPGSAALSWQELAPITGLVASYLLSHPIQFDQDVRQQFYDTNPAFLLATIAASQWPYKGDLFGEHARPIIIYDEIPKQIAGHANVPRFDIAGSFLRINGVSLTDFIDVGFAAYAGTYSNPTFFRGWFDKARQQGLNLPPDQDVLQVLQHLAADPKTLRKVWHRHRCDERRFAMYDLNPLFLYPVVRPWRQRRVPRPDDDRMISPLPSLIPYRMSTGVFYQLFNVYGEPFAQYFGHVFEAYVGEILKHSVAAGRLNSEADIRSRYSNGKVPDWVVVEGATAILIECKATRFSRAALTTGSAKAIDDSLKQSLKGLRQLYEFREACKAKRAGLEAFHRCGAFEPVLVTLEPLYHANRTLFRSYIDGKLAEGGTTNLPWLVVTMDELERLQPHLAAGTGLAEAVTQLRVDPFLKVQARLYEQTRLTYKDSFLYAKDIELYKRLGMSDGA